MGTGTHTLIPTDHSGSCSHSPARPDPLPSALTEPGSPQTAHSSLQSRLRWPEQCPCPHLRTALNLLTYVWFMSSHTQCTCLRMWEAQEKLAGAGHLLQPGLCTRPAPRGDFFHFLSSQLEPGIIPSLSTPLSLSKSHLKPEPEHAFQRLCSSPQRTASEH